MPAPEEHGIRVHLTELLARRNMTLTRLAELVGVSVVNLSLLKNGHAKAIRLTTLGAICAALDCQPGDLLSHHSRPG
jgi:putative transcriptional regulator